MKNKKIVVNNNRTRIPKGITPESIKAIVSKRNAPVVSSSYAEKNKEGKTVVKKFYKRATTSGIKSTPTIRPEIKNVISLENNIITKLDLPEDGSFNAGLVRMPNSDKYICVYRPNEYNFFGCFLNNDLTIDKKSYFKFSMSNCADPRLTWLPDNRLLMSYSSTSEVGFRFECIRGSIIMDLNKSDSFIDGQPFRISPESFKDRQKNWMPFVCNDKLYMTASVCPHIVYEVGVGKDKFDILNKYENSWYSPWMFKEFLRGNTNAVQLDDGNFLGTFHTATWHEGRCYYDNGCYLFQGKPPFKVLKCANRTYLRAEDAIEPHFRKKNLLKCTFPVGMVKEDNRLLISYGDNDSCVKIMETTVDSMLDLMLEVY